MLYVVACLLIAQSVSYPVGRDPRAVAVIDVNGDGQLDIVTANAGSRDVSTLLADDRGALKPGPSSPAMLEPAWMATADVNGDGFSDLALAEHESHRVAILLGDGAARFRQAPGSPFLFLATTPQHVHGLAFGDSNADGRVDLLTANNAGQSLSVLLGDGRGRFSPASSSPVPIARLTAGLAVGDVTGDGRLDVVAPGEGATDLTVLRGDGRGGLVVLEPRTPLPASGNTVSIGTVNNDATPDVVVAHNESALVTVLLGDGRGGLSPGPGLQPGHVPRSPVLRDLNGDGMTDLLLLDVQAGRLTIWLGDGAGAFRPAPGSPIAVGKAPIMLAAVHRSDGRWMIATANSGSNDVSVIVRPPD